jgi:hypothetical protein
MSSTNTTTANTTANTKSIIVFDTETTGLFDRKFELIEENINMYPHIVSLSCIKYNYNPDKNIKAGNLVDFVHKIVKLPNDIVIPEMAIAVHKITNSMCSQYGEEIFGVLKEFFDTFMELSKEEYVLVAHNMYYDKRLIEAEIIRLLMSFRHEKKRIERQQNEEIMTRSKSASYETRLNECKKNKEMVQRWRDKFYESKKVCTMMNAQPIFRKWPKLEALHKYYFGNVPDGLHNSLVDTSVCLRCYCKMFHNEDIGKIVFEKENEGHNSHNKHHHQQQHENKHHQHHQHHHHHNTVARA